MPSKAKQKFEAKSGRMDDALIEVTVTGKVKGHPEDIKSMFTQFGYTASDYGVDLEITGAEV